MILLKAYINMPKDLEPVEVFGAYNKRVKYLSRKFDVDIYLKDNKITINSESDKNNKIVKKIFKELIDILEEGHLPKWNQFLYIISRNTGEDIDTSKTMKEVVNTTINGVKISAKTDGQAKYIEDLKNNEIVFSIGPAGTGKTYLAVAMAVDYLKKGKVQRLILTRPAVEAGEKLGFLPGTLYEKVDPYLKPLYDSLIDFLGVEKVNFYKEKGIIEIVPLAYMRGRTLNNSFIILDEAQNSTYQQMKMFLTRIGFNSQVVVTGDITQIDLEKKKDSGLLAVSKFLTDINGIKFNELKKSDVVRNPLVKEIINAYEIFEKDSE